MKAGDIIVVIDNEYNAEFYAVGDKAILIYEGEDNDWYADFTINTEYMNQLFSVGEMVIL